MNLQKIKENCDKFPHLITFGDIRWLIQEVERLEIDNEHLKKRLKDTPCNEDKEVNCPHCNRPMMSETVYIVKGTANNGTPFYRILSKKINAVKYANGGYEVWEADFTNGSFKLFGGEK